MFIPGRVREGIELPISTQRIRERGDAFPNNDRSIIDALRMSADTIGGFIKAQPC